MAESETVDLSGPNTVDVGVLGDLLNLVMERLEALEKAQPKPPGPTDCELDAKHKLDDLNLALDAANCDGSEPRITLDTNGVCPQVRIGWYRRP